MSETKTRPMTQTCLCGCGSPCHKFFKQGHDARWNGWLKKAARGEGSPTSLFGRSLSRRLGPWTDNGDGGKVPSKSYADLRDLSKAA